MDRKMNRGSYRTGYSGATYGVSARRKKKKRFSMLKILRYVVLLGLIALFVWLGATFITGRRGRTNVGDVTRVGATLNRNVTPFGERMIFYDGTTLHCMNHRGSNDWSYQIGANADYDVTDRRVVAWSGNDVYILDERGRLVYNEKMTDSIQFASVGEEYVAVFIGEPDNGVITVVNAQGLIVDNITVEDQTLLDIGFFKSVTSNSAQMTELMWVLGLDTTGTVLSTEMQTFQPGKLATGKSSLGDHIAYKVYDVNGSLNVVDTRQIRHYNYRVLEEKASTLIYGYVMEDVKKVGATTYQLLVPTQENDGYAQISNVRLMYDNVDRVLHLPSECMATALGTRAVYGFSYNAVYVCEYGDTAFKSFSLPINITAVLGMIEGNRVIAASGSEIYVIELPESV